MKSHNPRNEGAPESPVHARLTEGDRAVIMAGMHGVDVSLWIAYQIVRNMQLPETAAEQQRQQETGAAVLSLQGWQNQRAAGAAGAATVQQEFTADAA
jgi:hypothetical protein